MRDLNLDTFSETIQTRTPSMAAIEMMLEELGLINIWGLLHPQKRDYTFFSHLHATYSNYLLVSRAVENQVLSATTGYMALTDHSYIP